MDLPGSTYLSALTGLSMSFVGFSTIAIAFLKATDSTLSEVHFAFVRIFFTNGLAAAAFSLLPLLMRLLGLPGDVVWRLSSVLLAIFGLTLLLIGIRARWRIEGWPIPLRVLTNYTITIVISVLLGLNAAGLLFDPYIGPYALGVTWLLAIAALIFVQNLTIFLQQRPGGSD